MFRVGYSGRVQGMFHIFPSGAAPRTLCGKDVPDSWAKTALGCTSHVNCQECKDKETGK